MTETDATRLREDYFARLDAAMSQVPHGVASEIRGGIAEELDGLDAAATAARIAQLGDPREIAAEARAEAPAVAQTVVPQAAKVPATQSRGFAITAALVFAFGGFLVPVVGWFVGVVMVASSSLWRRWEKILAITLPFGVIMLIAAGTLIIRLVSPAEHEVQNPLLPASYDIWNSSILLVFVLIPIVGGWLLWRLRRR